MALASRAVLDRELTATSLQHGLGRFGMAQGLRLAPDSGRASDIPVPQRSSPRRVQDAPGAAFLATPMVWSGLTLSGPESGQQRRGLPSERMCAFQPNVKDIRREQRVVGDRLYGAERL